MWKSPEWLPRKIEELEQRKQSDLQASSNNLFDLIQIENQYDSVIKKLQTLRVRDTTSPKTPGSPEGQRPS
jgi:hypothetical protein